MESGAHDSLIRLLDTAVKTGDLGAQANAATALLNLAQVRLANLYYALVHKDCFTRPDSGSMVTINILE
eukprot:scaffold85131_cov22-Prasinocladus_malaysianus.AAC.1